MGSVLYQDFKIISNFNLPWEKLKNATILITGATGLIGSLLVKFLCYISTKKKLDLSVCAAIRDIHRAEEMFLGFDVKFIICDIKQQIVVKENIDYIIHCAANTNSKEMITYPVENIQTSVYGTENVLKLAIEKQIQSMVYLSSMEVYGITNPSLEMISECDLGYIDLRSARSCYPESKRMCELMCNCYYSEYAVPVKIARLAQTFGAGVHKNERRVFSQFATSAMNGENIILHTSGNSIGNYCYTADVIKGILLLLLKGENGEPYNISNEECCMSIYQMAELVADKIAGGKISPVIKIPKENMGYAPTVKMKLSSAKIKKLGWTCEFDIVDMYKRMIEHLKGY